jgi:hypothetical protein
MSVLELSPPSTGIHTSLDGSPTLPPRRPTADKPSPSTAQRSPLPQQRPSLPQHAPTRPVLPRNPFPLAHPRSAGGLSVPKRNASSTSAMTHMLPSLSLTVSAVRPATSGSASAPTRRTAQFRGMPIARAASRAKGTSSTVSPVTIHAHFFRGSSLPTCRTKDPAPPFVTAYPDDRKHDGDRVFCKACNSWISVGPEGQAAQAWSQHRAQCTQVSPAAAPPPPASDMSAAPGPTHPRYAAPSSSVVQATDRTKMKMFQQCPPTITAPAGARFCAPTSGYTRRQGQGK